MNKAQIGTVAIISAILIAVSSPYWLHHYKDLEQPTFEYLTSSMTSQILKSEGDAAFMRKLEDAIDFADASERRMQIDEYAEYKNTLKLCENDQDFFGKNAVKCNFTQRKEDRFKNSEPEFRPRNSFYFYERFLGACYWERTIGEAVRSNCLPPY